MCGNCKQNIHMLNGGTHYGPLHLGVIQPSILVSYKNLARQNEVGVGDKTKLASSTHYSMSRLAVMCNNIEWFRQWVFDHLLCGSSRLSGWQNLPLHLFELFCFRHLHWRLILSVCLSVVSFSVSLLQHWNVFPCFFGAVPRSNQGVFLAFLFLEVVVLNHTSEDVYKALKVHSVWTGLFKHSGLTIIILIMLGINLSYFWCLIFSLAMPFQKSYWNKLWTVEWLKSQQISKNCCM